MNLKITKLKVEIYTLRTSFKSSKNCAAPKQPCSGAAAVQLLPAWPRGTPPPHSISLHRTSNFHSPSPLGNAHHPVLSKIK